MTEPGLQIYFCFIKIKERRKNMTEEQRDEILLEIANKVDFNTKQIEAINMTMSNHTVQISGM